MSNLKTPSRPVFPQVRRQSSKIIFKQIDRLIFFAFGFASASLIVLIVLIIF